MEYAIIYYYLVTINFLYEAIPFLLFALIMFFIGYGLDRLFNK